MQGVAMRCFQRTVTERGPALHMRTIPWPRQNKGGERGSWVKTGNSPSTLPSGPWLTHTVQLCLSCHSGLSPDTGSQSKPFCPWLMTDIPSHGHRSNSNTSLPVSLPVRTSHTASLREGNRGAGKQPLGHTRLGLLRAKGAEVHNGMGRRQGQWCHPQRGYIFTGS